MIGLQSDEHVWAWRRHRFHTTGCWPFVANATPQWSVLDWS